MWAEAISNGGKKGILAAATLSSQHQVVVWICFSDDVFSKLNTNIFHNKHDKHPYFVIFLVDNV